MFDYEQVRCPSELSTISGMSVNYRDALTDAMFKEASWDWVQNTTTATTKWGTLGDWDVSEVRDFSLAFDTSRNKAGEPVVGGNPKAANVGLVAISGWKTTSLTTLSRTFFGARFMDADLSSWDVSKVVALNFTFAYARRFTGTGLARWKTASVTTLTSTFHEASSMNVDLGGWDVAKVVSMTNMFHQAVRFEGTGLSRWSVGKITDMASAFSGAKRLLSCNKREIADAWAGNAAFKATTYDTDWSVYTCPPPLVDPACWRDVRVHLSSPPAVLTGTDDAGAASGTIHGAELQGLAVSARLVVTEYVNAAAIVLAKRLGQKSTYPSSSSSASPSRFAPMAGLFIISARGGERLTLDFARQAATVSPLSTFATVITCPRIDSNVTLQVFVGGGGTPRTPVTVQRISDGGYSAQIELPSYGAVCEGSQEARVACAASPQVLELVAVHGNATSWGGTKAFNWTCPPHCPKGVGSAIEQQVNRTRQLTQQTERRQWRGAATSGMRRIKYGDLQVGGTRLSRRLVPIRGKDGGSSSSSSDDDSAVYLDDPGAAAAVAAVGGILYSEQCTGNNSSPTTSPTTSSNSSGSGGETSTVGGNTSTTAFLPSVIGPYDTQLTTCLDPGLAASRCAFGEGGACVSCPDNARCPGGRRAWPVAGFWASSENTSKIRACAAPSFERCRGLLHGSLGAFQCGPGYEGNDCARCKKEFYEEALTGRCLRCGGGGGGGRQHSVLSKAADMAQKATPLFILLGALVFAFLGIGGIVIAIQRHSGGTRGGGMQRAFHFIIYVVVLLQTTMYCSSMATREAVSGAAFYFRSGGAEEDAAWRAIAEAVGSFYSTFNVFQLDFSDALQLPCLGVSPFMVEKIYAAVMYIVLFAWTFLAVFITVRSRDTAAVETSMAGAIEMVKLSGISEDATSTSRVGLRHLSSRGRRSTKTLRKLAGIQHRLNTAGYVLYAVTCKISLTLLHCPAADADADCHTAGQRPPELVGVIAGLVVFHLVFFPVASFCAAARVHRIRMGGSCCGDSPATVQSQLCNHKAEVEVAVWRCVLSGRFLLLCLLGPIP